MDIADEMDLLTGERIEVDLWQKYNGFTPKFFERWLHTDGGIVGQDAAVKAAAIILYNHIQKRRSVNLFIAESGSGKSYLWQVLQKECGADKICIFDGSTLTPEGWKGDNKISTIFRDIPFDCRSRIILVLDEIDKIFLSSGLSSEYANSIQSQLLRLFNGDTLIFAGENGFAVDTSEITIVLLGAFQGLHDKKKQKRTSTGVIGFHREQPAGSENGSTEITTDDLIAYGMKRELAGRITRTVCMNSLSADDLVRIGHQEVKRLEKQIQRKISADNSVILHLAHIAVKKQLGARWIKSQLANILDELIYENPHAERYEIDFSLVEADNTVEAECAE